VQASYTGTGFARIAPYQKPGTATIGVAASPQCGRKGARRNADCRPGEVESASVEVAGEVMSNGRDYADKAAIVAGLKPRLLLACVALCASASTPASLADVKQIAIAGVTVVNPEREAKDAAVADATVVIS